MLGGRFRIAARQSVAAWFLRRAIVTRKISDFSNSGREFQNCAAPLACAEKSLIFSNSGTGENKNYQNLGGGSPCRRAACVRGKIFDF